MSLFLLAQILAASWFCCWLATQMPAPPAFKNVVVWVIYLFLLVLVLQMLGIQTGVPPLSLK